MMILKKNTQAHEGKNTRKLPQKTCVVVGRLAYACSDPCSMRPSADHWIGFLAESDEIWCLGSLMVYIQEWLLDHVDNPWRSAEQTCVRSVCCVFLSFSNLAHQYLPEKSFYPCLAPWPVELILMVPTGL